MSEPIKFDGLGVETRDFIGQAVLFSSRQYDFIAGKKSYSLRGMIERRDASAFFHRYHSESYYKDFTDFEKYFEYFLSLLAVRLFLLFFF